MQRQWEQLEERVVRDDPEYFRLDILPALSKVKLIDIMTAVGFSKSFASQVRRGEYLPHVSTWSALERLASGEFNDS